MIDGLKYVPLSDIGMERDENQDYQGHDVTRFGMLFVVADGMGGHAGGATASQMAVNVIKRTLWETEQTSPRLALEEAIQKANYAIWRTAQDRFDLRGMGSTVVAMILTEDVAWVAHVGDSRIYLLRGNNFMRVTKDHTMVQRMVDDGLLTEDASRNHPNSHILSRSLGGTREVLVETAAYPIRNQKGDRWLLCSDGLTGPLEDLEVGRILRDFPLHEAARLFVDEANARGGLDNTTVALIEIGATPIPNARTTLQDNVAPPPPPPAPPSAPVEENEASAHEDAEADEETLQEDNAERPEAAEAPSEDSEETPEEPTEAEDDAESEASGDEADDDEEDAEDTPEDDGDAEAEAEASSDEEDGDDAEDAEEKDEEAPEKVEEAKDSDKDDAEETEEEAKEDNGEDSDEGDADDVSDKADDADEDNAEADDAEEPPSPTPPAEETPEDDEVPFELDDMGAALPQHIAYGTLDLGTGKFAVSGLSPNRFPQPMTAATPEQPSLAGDRTVTLIVAAAALSVGILLGFLAGHYDVPKLENALRETGDRAAELTILNESVTKERDSLLEDAKESTTQVDVLSKERDDLRGRVTDMSRSLDTAQKLTTSLQEELEACKKGDEPDPEADTPAPE